MNKIIDRLERAGHKILLPCEHCPEFECHTDEYVINGNISGTTAQIRSGTTLDLIAEYNSMLDSVTTYSLNQSELPRIYNIFIGDNDV
jgi:hypothetical protein